MDNLQQDNKAFQAAYRFLLDLAYPGVTEEILEKYMTFSARHTPPLPIAVIYRQLLESAQNAQMRAGVLRGYIGSIDHLSSILSEFDPELVAEEYGQDFWKLLAAIETVSSKPVRKEPRSVLPLFCRAALSGAQFLHRFRDGAEFHDWVSFFDKDTRARPALPLLISAEVFGIGFPLACDFLKELGYANFAKPDVHLREIFTATGLCPPKSDDFQVFKAITRVAGNVNRTPYAVDKIFWLIGSGHFYGDRQIGNNGRIGSHKKEFIAHLRTKLD